MALKVCLDARLLGCHGIGTYLKQLIPKMVHAPFEWHVLAKPIDVPWFESIEGLRVYPMKSPIYSVQEQIELPRKIPKGAIFWSPHYNVPLLPLRTHCRLVTIHDAYPLVYYHTLTPLQKGYARLVFAQAARRSDWIFTNSEFSKGQLIDLLSIQEKKIQIVPLGVDHKLFASLQRAPKIGAPFFLMVGCMKPHKNFRKVVEALEILSRRGSLDFIIVAVGGAPETLKHVTSLQSVTDEELAALYQHAEALLYPSLYEGFGLPPLEAMAAGCPVIASHAAAIPETCGQAALYIDPHSAEALAQAMQQIRSDRNLRQKMIGLGKAHAVNKSWAACADAHIQTLRGL